MSRVGAVVFKHVAVIFIFNVGSYNSKRNSLLLDIFMVKVQEYNTLKSRALML
jgi:hypothetical protein